ncbi:MAG: ester cyclase [Candidatus Acidiferrum sp.]
MFDGETNKAIVLGLVEVSTTADLTCLRIKRYPTCEPRCSTLSRKATRSYSSIALVVRHRGEFFGRPGTGDRIEWMAIHIDTIRGGKVLEDAVMTDALAIMQRLGFVPSLTVTDHLVARSRQTARYPYT